MKIPKILTAKTLHWGKLVNIALGFQILGSGFDNCDWHRQIMQVFVERGLSKDLGHLPIKFNSIWKFQQMVTAGTKSFSIPTIFCYLLMFGYMTPWGEKLRWSRSISLRSGLGLAWLLEKKRSEELPSNMGKLKNITLVKNYLYSWWFQTFIYVHPYLGKIPILTIFSIGLKPPPSYCFLICCRVNVSLKTTCDCNLWRDGTWEPNIHIWHIHVYKLCVPVYKLCVPDKITLQYIVLSRNSWTGKYARF